MPPSWRWLTACWLVGAIMFDAQATLQQLRLQYQGMLQRPDLTETERKFYTDVLMLLVFSEAALSYTPASALLRHPPITECPTCDGPITRVSVPFKDTFTLDYGVQTPIVTLDGQAVSGGLHSVLIRNEAGVHIGLPRHVCWREIRRRG